MASGKVMATYHGGHADPGGIVVIDGIEMRDGGDPVELTREQFDRLRADKTVNGKVREAEPETGAAKKA